MLVIRRRAGQSIRIGENVEIHVAEIGATRVAIAIHAPREVAVTRSEVTLTKEQNLAAADSVTAEALARLTRALLDRRH
jgi:carbon storage regulator